MQCGVLECDGSENRNLGIMFNAIKDIAISFLTTIGFRKYGEDSLTGTKDTRDFMSLSRGSIIMRE